MSDPPMAKKVWARLSVSVTERSTLRVTSDWRSVDRLELKEG